MTESEWKDIFGDNLMSILKEKGWTQSMLSSYTDISKSMINDYINKKRVPTLFAAIKIADALSIGLEELAYFDETVT